MGCPAFLQRVFVTQKSSPYLLCLLYCRWIPYLLSHRGSPVLCKGRYKSVGSLKALLSYVPQLSGAWILCFHILNFLSVHHLTLCDSCNCWWLSHSCLLIRQETFCFSSSAWFSMKGGCYNEKEKRGRGFPFPFLTAKKIKRTVNGPEHSWFLL